MYTENMFFHPNISVNALTPKCVRTYKSHAVCISVEYWTAHELYGRYNLFVDNRLVHVSYLHYFHDNGITQQAADVNTTSPQRRCNVKALHRRLADVV